MKHVCLAALFAAFALLPALNHTLLADEKPNVILVFIDDMGWGDFSCFGNDEVETENIDRRRSPIHQLLRQLADLLAVEDGHLDRTVSAALADYVVLGPS